VGEVINTYLRKDENFMANLFTMYLKAKGCESDLATLKSDVLKHCNLITSTAPGATIREYWVDLAAWNPNRQDWVTEPLGWCLELRKGKSELLAIKDGQLTAHAVGRWGAPLHFLDGLRELYPHLELSAYAIDLSNGFGEDWKCSPEGTFCVQEVQSCWEGEEVWRWVKDGKLMIDDGKPVAEELRGFAGNPFVLVEGVPLSITLDAAKEHVWKQAEENPSFLECLLCDWSRLDSTKRPFGSRAEKCDDRATSGEDDFFAALKNLYLTQMTRKEAE
jgi:hypothetical protein